ncbi:MAG: hypothetical protein WDM90_11350 [Ferruginibacter sp.]
MIDTSKILLSDGEMQLVTNTNWILTKRVIIDKVNILFGHLADAMQEQLLTEKEMLPLAVIQSTPKIAKGENYLQLPYVLLDYPRCFDKENVFAIRTMFWWGNFFSCTLHLSGSYKIFFQQAIEKILMPLQKNDLYICNGNNEWQHHFEKSNYVAANTLSEEEIKAIFMQQHFVKVAAKFSLYQWNDIEVLLQKSFSGLLHLLKY